MAQHFYIVAIEWAYTEYPLLHSVHSATIQCTMSSNSDNVHI